MLTADGFLGAKNETQVVSLKLLDARGQLCGSELG